MALLPSEQLHAMAEAFGDETAYTVVGYGSMTFAEWDTTATRLARGLVESGIAPGDRVAIHLQASNALRWMSVYAAVHRAGAVAVPCNPQLTRPEVARMMAHSGTTVAFVEHSLLDRHEPSRPTRVVNVPEVGDDSGAGPAPDGVASWSDALHPDATYFQIPRDRSELADILYTSGTTGHPKAVAVRHDNSSLVPFREPTWSGGSWLHASPPYTFAGIAFVLTPM
ncbi:MAG TPA: AMP-binding protein, partial [Acidimicrobiales bacterium]